MRDHERFQQLGGGGDRSVRRSGRIIAVARGIYSIETDRGQVIRAEADGSYRINQRVSVLAGRIVGLAAGSKNIESVRG